MLVLQRKPVQGQSDIICRIPPGYAGGELRIHINRVLKGKRIKVGIVADPQIIIMRAELVDPEKRSA